MPGSEWSKNNVKFVKLWSWFANLTFSCKTWGANSDLYAYKKYAFIILFKIYYNYAHSNHRKQHAIHKFHVENKFEVALLTPILPHITAQNDAILIRIVTLQM